MSESARYLIVEEENVSSVPVDPGVEAEAEEYWKQVTASASPETAPRLIIMYGTPGCGKSRVLQHFLNERSWTTEEFVHLDPDVLRYYSTAYRSSLNGAYAARLDTVNAEFGGRLQPAQWRSPVGEFVEHGMQVDGKWLALANAGLRSTAFVRKHMLWGPPTYALPSGEPLPQWQEGAVQVPCPVGEAFVDRALSQGYSVIYDTHGGAPTTDLPPRTVRCD